jgi:elongation factor Ts
VSATADGKLATLTEVNSETDFVARNEEFQNVVREIGVLSLGAGGDTAALAASKMSTGQTVTNFLVELVARIGENMSLRRTAEVKVSEGVVTTYMHNAVADGLGKIGVLVGLQSMGSKDALNALGKKIAMHVAATAPLALSVDSLDPADVAKERAALVAEALESGKPESIVERMVDGRMNKF